LVYFELHTGMYEAISREKQLKAGSRAKKLALVEAANANWSDLYPGLL
jgi:predicted GIY-YIG superfamily endonuclease